MINDKLLNEIIRDTIREKLKELADYIIEYTGTYREYSDEDLFNAVEIFAEIFMSKLWEAQKPKTSVEIAEKAGTDIRNLIIKYLKIDMHEVAKKLLEVK